MQLGLCDELACTTKQPLAATTVLRPIDSGVQANRARYTAAAAL
jgi:hypothetical protein